MPTTTIDRLDAIELFNQLMQQNSPCRVLLLSGQAKMGKSHLIARVFPSLARETYQRRCAVLDLRNPAQTIPDFLHAACTLLGDPSEFPAYYTAHREWLNRPQVEVKGLRAVLASVAVRAGDEGDESRKWVRHLTAEFATDLGRLADAPLVLLFDALDAANESTRDWLINTLLVQLVPLAHVRVVVAGRWVPEPLVSYAAACDSYELPPVEAEEEYIVYCHQVGAHLPEQSIRDIAFLCEYKPGFFVDFVTPRSTRREIAHV
jgi:hypothetical protein